jgi:hypothetical protein
MSELYQYITHINLRHIKQQNKNRLWCIEVTINAIYAALFMYSPLLEDAVLIDMFLLSLAIFRQYTYDFTKIIIPTTDTLFF